MYRRDKEGQISCKASNPPAEMVAMKPLWICEGESISQIGRGRINSSKN